MLSLPCLLSQSSRLTALKHRRVQPSNCGNTYMDIDAVIAAGKKMGYEGETLSCGRKPNKQHSTY